MGVQKFVYDYGCLLIYLNDSDWYVQTHTRLTIDQCDQMLKNKYPKIFQKVTTEVYARKWMFSKLPKKSTYIWATCVRKFVTKNFQKSPNLVVTLNISDPNKSN